MSYSLEYIMECPDKPCKYELCDTLELCFNRIQELNKLPIKWYQFRISEMPEYHGSWIKYTDSYLIKLYNRRNAKCGS